jgi:quercetin dioxygenase-like cupin family protein
MKLEKISEKMVYMDNTLTKRILFNEDKVLSFVLNFRPGQGVPPHNHEESDLIVNVLVGEGEMVVDGKSNRVVQGDIIYCVGAEVFSITNNSDKDMSCLVILAPNPSPVYSKEV